MTEKAWILHIFPAFWRDIGLAISKRNLQIGTALVLVPLVVTLTSINYPIRGDPGGREVYPLQMPLISLVLTFLPDLHILMAR